MMDELCHLGDDLFKSFFDWYRNTSTILNKDGYPVDPVFNLGVEHDALAWTSGIRMYARATSKEGREMATVLHWPLTRMAAAAPPGGAIVQRPGGLDGFTIG